MNISAEGLVATPWKILPSASSTSPPALEQSRAHKTAFCLPCMVKITADAWKNLSLKSLWTPASQWSSLSHDNWNMLSRISMWPCVIRALWGKVLTCINKPLGLNRVFSVDSLQVKFRRKVGLCVNGVWFKFGHFCISWILQDVCGFNLSSRSVKCTLRQAWRAFI